MPGACVIVVRRANSGPELALANRTLFAVTKSSDRAQQKHRVAQPTSSTPGPESQAPIVLELGLAIIIAVVSIFIVIMMPALVQEGGIQEAQDFLRLTPVFFPRLSFGLTGLISIVLIIRLVRGMSAQQQLIPAIDRTKLTGVLVMSVLIVLYGFMLPILGYGFATLLAAGITSYFLGLRSWPQLLTFSLLTPVVTRLVFERLLAISLPLSPYEPLALFEQNVMRFLAGLFAFGQ